MTQDINPKDVMEVALSLGSLHVSALTTPNIENGEGPKGLAGHLKVTTPVARAVLQRLRHDGVCDYSPLYNDEGALQGWGYWLGPFGLAVRDLLAMSEGAGT